MLLVKAVQLAFVLFFGIAIFLIGGLKPLIAFILAVLVIIAFVFAAWNLAKVNWFFTFVGKGQIKTIDRGEDNVIKVLENLDDHNAENMKIVPGPDRRNFLERNFGLYWIGLPPARIHEFEFVHERMNPKIGKDTPSDQWVLRDPAPKKTDYLLWEIPHSYLLQKVALKDGFEVDVLFNTRSRVVDPIIALYLRQGNFIDYMAQYVEAGVQTALREIDAETFRTTDMSEESPLSKRIIDIINAADERKGLPEAVGLTVLAGFVSKWDQSDKSDIEALKAREKARLAGEASIEAAKQGIEEAKLLAQAKKELASGELAGLEAALKIIFDKYPGIDPAFALEQATINNTASKFSQKDSPVTVLGTGVGIAVQQRERKD